jgi:ATP-dependent DNA helicase RecG
VIRGLAPDEVARLVQQLRGLPRETAWFEAKRNNERPDQIGENISAIANGAALASKAFGYIVWGLDDATHEIVGTTFVPSAAKVGNEELENWLIRLLTPRLDLQFAEVSIDGHRVVVLAFECASTQPVSFQGQECVRVGSYSKKLKDYPEKAKALWRTFERTPFEENLAAERLDDDEVLRLLDYPVYFQLLNLPLPGEKRGVLEALVGDRLIAHAEDGRWNVTNLGAAILARKLSDFARLRRKPVRIVAYKGASRVEASKEHVVDEGYGSAFGLVLKLLGGLVPSSEVIEQALRRSVPVYPELAMRELIVNALIHQDFAITGAGPMIEIFADRLEVTNPGAPLVDAARFLDMPPRSRNEALASLMRRMGMCEERGSGVDKVVFECEFHQLPAPLFESTGEATRAVLFAPRPLKKMAREDRIRACYLHACLRYVASEHLTNTSLRERFRLSDDAPAASRLIKEAVDAGMIVPVDPQASRRHMKYSPFWVRGE